ncbi:uncharacterized protein LOC112031846 [Quercus suber]|uniref:E3 ubiquitin-protein ligase ring1-like n=1 Tax=Quercus suber TaxID=58331 RepID=A0AAW0KEK8_QUESU|nr:e3 ubiquitin-protein ligase ring1-like [Quercus suber]
MSQSHSPTSPFCNEAYEVRVWQQPWPSQFGDVPPVLQTTLDCRFDAFFVQFRMQKLNRTENYVGNSEAPLTFEEASPVLRKSFFLSKHELMLHDNGAVLRSLFRGLDIPEEYHGTVSQLIATIASSAGTSRMPIFVDWLYTFTVKTVMVMPQYSSYVDEELDTVILESMENYEPKPTPATKSSVRALEKFRFHQGSSSVQECSICLEEFQNGSKVTRMPCSHVYHGKCIFKWLKTSHSCPLCRYPMPT